MYSFRIEPSVFSKIPNLCFGAVVARGVDNSRNIPEIAEMVEQQRIALNARLQDINIKEYPAILPYRETFKALNINPNKFMSSIEALCKRIQKGDKIPSINPIVDLGNVMSLKYLLPMGAHDINKLEGDLTVRFASPDDHFTPFGDTKTERPDDSELVYVSGNTVKTRRWIWRQSEDGKIDSTSKDLVFPIDGFIGINDDMVRAAQAELTELLVKLFDCEVHSGFLTADNLSIEL